MSRIYLINIGANTGHRQLARCPIFADGRFVYVSFPDEDGRQTYPTAMRPFLSPRCPSSTHLDPDWDDATYGDNCRNPRARALLKAKRNDILLFWALLWPNAGHSWATWTEEGRGWYLIGAIRIEETLEAGDSVLKVKPENRDRARRNAHVIEGNIRSASRNRLDRVFVGFKKHSRRFARAVDWEIYKTGGLFQRAVRTTDDKQVNWKRPPRWNSVTRSCRAVWDLNDAAERKRAHLIRNAIQERNPDFDLLAGQAD
jgi:hypothetical protein